MTALMLADTLAVLDAADTKRKAAKVRPDHATITLDVLSPELAAFGRVPLRPLLGWCKSLRKSKRRRFGLVTTRIEHREMFVTVYAEDRRGRKASQTSLAERRILQLHAADQHGRASTLRLIVEPLTDDEAAAQFEAMLS